MNLGLTDPADIHATVAKHQTEQIPQPVHADLGLAGGRARRWRAEDLIMEAFEVTGERRAALAGKALALWPDCADAYVLLSLSTSSLEQARELLEQGVAAGERALGRRAFAEEVGHVWLIFEARPYMRARAALAATLWRLGHSEEAVDHQRELLRLDPDDHQGIRYRQAWWLLELRCYNELVELFTAHEDDPAAAFAYTRALAAYCRDRDSDEARVLLAKARELNPHIPAYLTGRKALPRRRPRHMRLGEESEAIDYAAGTRGLWASAPGALAWLDS
jgi:tetratricopeptide (TPR) repeat protein